MTLIVEPSLVAEPLIVTLLRGHRSQFLLGQLRGIVVVIPSLHNAVRHFVYKSHDSSVQILIR
jgi:hypothetical protein